MESCSNTHHLNEHEIFQSRREYGMDDIDEQRADFIIAIMAGHSARGLNSVWGHTIYDATHHLTKAEHAKLNEVCKGEYDNFLTEYREGKFNDYKRMLRAATERLADYLFYDAPLEDE